LGILVLIQLTSGSDHRFLCQSPADESVKPRRNRYRDNFCTSLVLGTNHILLRILNFSISLLWNIFGLSLNYLWIIILLIWITQRIGCTTNQDGTVGQDIFTIDHVADQGLTRVSAMFLCSQHLQYCSSYIKIIFEIFLEGLGYNALGLNSKIDYYLRRSDDLILKL